MRYTLIARLIGELDPGDSQAFRAALRTHALTDDEALILSEKLVDKNRALLAAHHAGATALPSAEAWTRLTLLALHIAASDDRRAWFATVAYHKGQFCVFAREKRRDALEIYCESAEVFANAWEAALEQADDPYWPPEERGQ